MKQLIMLEKGDSVLAYVERGTCSMFRQAIVTETPDVHDSWVWVKCATDDSDGFGAPEEVKLSDICAFVGFYLVDRRYGGPEEGGWWYDWHTHLLSIPVKLLLGVSDNALRLFLADQFDLNEYDNGSVLGDGEIHQMNEAYPAEHESTERPHYE